MTKISCIRAKLEQIIYIMNINHFIYFIIAVFINPNRVKGKPANITSKDTQQIDLNSPQVDASTLLINGNQTTKPFNINNQLANECNVFTHGVSTTEFTSPLYPNKYPNNKECLKAITAPESHLVRLQFRDIFELEEPEDNKCKFDYLEIRDGPYAYSPLLGDKLCGKVAPVGDLDSTGRHVWLRFNSDATITFRGFRVIVSFVPAKTTTELNKCFEFLDQNQGRFGTSTIQNDTWERAKDFNSAVDCTWEVQADKDLRIFLQFDSSDLHLEKPNLCDLNFIQIYNSSDQIQGKGEEPPKHCGSTIENTRSVDNKLSVRFYSMLGPDSSKWSKFLANYTFQREVPGGKCPTDEFSCNDNTCIHKSLKCNNYINCQRPVDEEKCDTEGNQFTADIMVIALIGCLLIAGMCGGLILNIFRKLRQDKIDLQELRESIQKSRESMPQSERQSIKASLDQVKISSSPQVSSHDESGDTVIERPSSTRQSLQQNDLQLVPFQGRNGDVKKSVKAEVNPITYSPPPSYPHSTSKPFKVQSKNKNPEDDMTVVSRKSLPTFATTSTQAEVPSVPSELCIEVRDCACQTKESLLASRRRQILKKAPLARNEAIEFYDLSTSTPIRRVARMLPRSDGADIVAIYPYYAVSSASSETGRSLERLDEYQE